jgi:hypothetical protein
MQPGVNTVLGHKSLRTKPGSCRFLATDVQCHPDAEDRHVINTPREPGELRAQIASVSAKVRDAHARLLADRRTGWHAVGDIVNFHEGGFCCIITAGTAGPIPVRCPLLLPTSARSCSAAVKEEAVAAGGERFGRGIGAVECRVAEDERSTAGPRSDCGLSCRTASRQSGHLSVRCRSGLLVRAS